MVTEEDVHEHVRGICFKTGPPGLVGVESEWLVTDLDRPEAPVSIDRLTAALSGGPLPRGSVVTYEPGGQLELSAPPRDGPGAAYAALSTDLRHLDQRLAAARLARSGIGLDPRRPPRRMLDVPRYSAMEAYFDRDGPTGRIMMCSTASIQICLDIGCDPADARHRWELLHRLGPLFVAAFANSPLWRGRPTGWRSTRQAVWAALDSSRSRPVPTGDPAVAWARYALDARIMAIRRRGDPWIVDPGINFGEWLNTGNGRPTSDDLDFHLSTLFPPVRPRGWLELRMIDALPDPWWPVPVAIVAALIDDPRAADTAAEATAALPGWAVASRNGLADPALGRAAVACFSAALAALPRMGGADLVPLVEAYAERYVEPGRSPADDLLRELENA